MSAQGGPADSRCREIRERLPDFLRDRLGVVATGEVQGHLLACQACSEAYGHLIMEQVAGGTEPLPAPPFVPPAALYEEYLRNQSGRFGVLWTLVRESLRSADTGAREWAGEQLDLIREGVRQLLIPSPPLRPAPVRVRGAIRTRGGARESVPHRLDADVLSRAWQPTGVTLTFTIEERPQITRSGHFRVRLGTTTRGHEGYRVLCTVTLPATPPISFASFLKALPGAGRWEVLIDEEGLDGDAGDLPLDRLRFDVIEP